MVRVASSWAGRNRRHRRRRGPELATIGAVYAAIETSFDETGIAIWDARGRVRQSLLASQVERHAPYGGCVPELAARTHLSDLPQLWLRLEPELVKRIEYLGVTSGPGLPGCLLAGINFARGAARALCTPLYGLNHLSGHVFSPFMPDGTGVDEAAASAAIPYPHLALLISGGHTELFHVRSLTELKLLGQTQDDAVGELLDKVSALLGYGYPGGARLERIAASHPGWRADGSYEGAYSLPVPMRESGDLNFSYSGLKTAVVRMVRAAEDAGTPLPEEQHPSLLAALFHVIAESLWIKLEAALAQHPVKLITVSGGVAINGLLRRRLGYHAQRRGVALRFAAPQFCLDNADMMAWLLKLTVDGGLPPAPFDADSNANPGQPR